MTHIPSPETRPILVVASGSLGATVAAILADASVQSTVVGASQWSSIELKQDQYAAIVLATGRPLPDVAKYLDSVCWGACIPWLETTIVAHHYRIGPVIVPGVTPCYECWIRRVRSQAPDLVLHDALDAFAATGSDASWFAGELDALVDEVASIAAAKVASLARDSYPYPDHGMGRYWEGDAIGGTVMSRVYSRTGLCTRCVQRRQVDDSWKLLGAELAETNAK